jgi:ketosteroid isomerase-like protein
MTSVGDADARASTAAVARFSAAFDRHDVDAVMAAMTDDCTFESTAAPAGVRYEGQRAVRGAWTQFFATSPEAVFEAEEQIAFGDRVVVRWCYTWATGYVRGIDVYRIRDGLVAEKLSYVKG